MDDLDELLANLDNPRASARQSRNTVNYDELNELMQDLATPVDINSNKSNNNHNHAQNRVSQSPASYSSDTDGLDNLLADLSGAGNRNTQQPVRNAQQQQQQQQRNTQQPNRNTQQPQQPQHAVRATQQPVRNTQSGAQLDDLDELLRNLGPPSSTSSQSRQSNGSQFYDRPPVQHANVGHVQPQASVRNSSAPTRPAQQQAQPQQHYQQPQQQSQQQQQQQQQRGPGKVLDGPDLAAMLADINRTSTRLDHGGPSSRGDCAHCRKPILGEVIQALNQSYHPEHFVCGNCQAPLGTSNFYEQDGLPNCERCYQELFCSRCAHCDEPITGRCITALNRKWHADHFICADCLGPFPGGTFFEKEGRPYCENCFHKQFSARCGHCNQSIKGECINALGQQWHPEHFICHYCQKSFGNGSFFEYNNKPYCETHYHQQTGSLCAGCGKAVSGRMVNALDKKWHPEHFVCSFCMQPLAGGAFTENAGKAYCKECHGKLFG